MNRRTFLKLAGIGSLSVAAGCTSRPEKKLFSLVRAPSDTVTGKATWYASTCRECPAGCGILAKNREGRVIKVEGNPFHPINQGRLCMRGQAALQGVYNPDRIKTPLLRDGENWQVLSFTEAETILREKAGRAAKKGPNRVRMVTEVPGRCQMKLLSRSLEQWRSAPPLVFEPYAYESLKSANESVFGVEGLPSYRMEKADLLLSFGADFLETWLSPVEYSRKFKKMHSLKKGHKALFFHVSPYQSLTGANADRWVSCRPGSEAVIALGLIGHAMQSGKGRRLDPKMREFLRKVLPGYTREKTIARAGIEASLFDSLCAALDEARKPLVLGTGTGWPLGLQTDVAVNLLNLILDPDLTLFDFHHRHRVEAASRRSEIIASFNALKEEPVDLLLLNNVNPVYSIPPNSGIRKAIEKTDLFVVSFSNFMDETTEMADLILPVQLPLETWDEYAGEKGVVSTLQPTMGSLTGAPALGDVFIRTAFGDDAPAPNYMKYLYDDLLEKKHIHHGRGWIKALRQGGIFTSSPSMGASPKGISEGSVLKTLESLSDSPVSGLTLIACPSIRFFDGRGANRPWLCEVPDPLTRVAWQTPVLMHPKVLAKKGLVQGDILEIRSKWGTLKAPAYTTVGVIPGVMVMSLGQGHQAYGRYAENVGRNPNRVLAPETDPVCGGPIYMVGGADVKKAHKAARLVHTDGSRTQHGRKIALSVDLQVLKDQKASPKKEGLSMWDFPLTPPLPEGYRKNRDIYPPHEHDTYRWAMVVDLDKCIGCGACSTACYAENNIAVTGPARMLEGREMAWISVERYEDPADMQRALFLPMLCQHCDNAPCESVCPVYAPHHSKEGLNNQIYNRCIGTRFCSQNCPYKVRRFNWFDWDWPGALSLQLNPDVTVRSKGVMEKCSFCIQRIKEAHGVAKDEKRKIMDGEIQPACLQTCPTGVFTFGNLMDPRSRVSKMIRDRRAYQVMGYLNTKPAVIYLKKVLQEI